MFTFFKFLEEEVSEEEEYIPKRSAPKKRGRPRKKPKSEFEDDPDFKKEVPDHTDWVYSHVFACFECSEQVTGFQGALEHVSEKHQDSEQDLDGKPSYPCIVCPSSFGRKEHMKRHLYTHVVEEGNEDNKINILLDFEDDLQLSLIHI